MILVTTCAAVFAVALIMGFVLGATAAGGLDPVDTRAGDIDDAWRREVERHRAEAKRWRGRALRSGWKWDTVDAIRAWRRGR